MPLETAQEQFWKGDFGRSYTERNRPDWSARIAFWQNIIDLTGARSVLDVGTNCGWNLRALRAIDKSIVAQGAEINETAMHEAWTAGLDVFPAAASEVGELWPGAYELAATSGVLIHIAPSEIRAAMASIAKASSRYVLAVEYAAETEEEIDYRGHSERLWKRPFGKLYEDLGLKLIASGEAEGFDRCEVWLLSKGNA